MNTGDKTINLWANEAVGALPAGTQRILGQGLWGPTIELGDGSLLKLVRRRAGIGDGAEIYANEARVLALLRGQHIEGLALPRLLDHGIFAPATTAAAAGFAAWLRISRVPGRLCGEADLAAFSESGRVRFARSLGRALARLQRDAARIAGDHLAGLEARTRSLLQTLAIASPDPMDCELARHLLAAVEAIPSDRRNRFVHGDAHLQNLTVDGNGEVCGFFDLAESGLGFAEIDLAYLHWLPDIAEPVRQSFAATAGPIDEAAYYLAGAIYALTGCVIARQHGEPVHADQAVLERCIAFMRNSC